MFLNSENYLDQVKQLIADSQQLSIAVAFWGKDAEKLFEDWQGKSLRIICNLESGATNPRVISAIRDWQGKKAFKVEVRTLADLHAKVVLGDYKAIIGSANISSNGLGYESSECGGWQEAGLRSSDQQVLKDAGEWYELQWQRAGHALTDDQLDQARLAWAKHRASRPNPSSNANSLLDAPFEALLDRPIYLAIYRIKRTSEKAQAAAMHARKQASCSQELELQNADLDFFEDWPDDAEETLIKDAPLIQVYFGPNKGTSVEGIWQRVPQLDQSYEGDDGGDITVLIMARLQDALGWTLSRAKQQELAKRLKPWLTMLYSDIGEDDQWCAHCRRLDEFLIWEAEHDGKLL